MNLYILYSFYSLIRLLSYSKLKQGIGQVNGHGWVISCVDSPSVRSSLLPVPRNTVYIIQLLTGDEGNI